MDWVSLLSQICIVKSTHSLWSVYSVSTYSGQSDTRAKQLETMIQTYEVQLEQEKDETKQKQIEQKISQLQAQLEATQTQKTSQSSQTSAESNTTTVADVFNQPAGTVSISEEGKALANSIKLIQSSQETVDNKEEVREKKVVGQEEQLEESEVEEALQDQVNEHQVQEQQMQKFVDPRILILV